MPGCQNLEAYKTWLPKLSSKFSFKSLPPWYPGLLKISPLFKIYIVQIFKSPNFVKMSHVIMSAQCVHGI